MEKYKNALQEGAVLKGASYKYRIEKVLGQGSFGITYLASVEMEGPLGTINVNIKVAIKEFFMREVNGRYGTAVTSGSKGGLFYDYKKKFVREARNLSKLQHPNIIKVMEEFEANDTAYYVMEYIDGGSLDDYIADHHGLPADEAVRLTREIGGALSFMHSKNMLHLDLKPGNIMRRKSGELVLIDYGLSKQYDENGEAESSTTIGKGTRGYAPIEQMYYQEGKSFPVTMDVYALGATLLKMLTGETPPDSSYILNEGFPFEGLDTLGIVLDLQHYVAKAMAAKKSERYQSVADFIYELGTVKTGTTGGNDEKTFMEDSEDDLLIVEVHRNKKSINDIIKDADKVAISYTPYNSFGPGTYVVMIDSTKVKMVIHSWPIEFAFNENSYKNFKEKLHLFVSKLELRKKDIPFKMEASKDAPLLQIEFFCGGKLRKRLWIGGFHCQFGNIIGDTLELKNQLVQIIPFKDAMPGYGRVSEEAERLHLAEKPTEPINKQKRHLLTNLVLWGLQVASIFCFIASLVVIYDSLNWIKEDASWLWRSGMPHLCVGSVVVFSFNGMVLRWMKDGFFYLASFVMIIQYIFIFFSVELYLFTTVGTFICLALYYGVLKIKHNGYSTWSLMKQSSAIPCALFVRTLLLWAPLLICKSLHVRQEITFVALIIFALYCFVHIYLGRRQIREGE